MKKSELKIITGFMVAESTKISKKDKIKLLDFVKEEASIYQMMGFILDQEMYDLNKSQEKIVKERFIKEQGKVTPYRKTAFGHLYGPTGMVASGAINIPMGGVKRASAHTLVALAGWAGYRALRAKFDNCTKGCGTFKINNPKRQLCLFKCKAANLKAEITALKKLKASESQISKKEKQLQKVLKKLQNYQKFE